MASHGNTVNSDKRQMGPYMGPFCWEECEGFTATPAKIRGALQCLLEIRKECQVSKISRTY